jgi:hypothetical protein
VPWGQFNSIQHVSLCALLGTGCVFPALQLGVRQNTARCPLKNTGGHAGQLYVANRYALPQWWQWWGVAVRPEVPFVAFGGCLFLCAWVGTMLLSSSLGEPI